MSKIYDEHGRPDRGHIIRPPAIQKGLIPLLIAGICSATLSLLCVDFRMLPHSEEAGAASWGFPFPMVETSPVYVGYMGIPARQGGAQYLRNAMGALDNPQVHPVGVLLNVGFYASLPLAARELARHRLRIYGSLAAYLDESGVLGGIASLLGVSMLIAVLVLVTYGILKWLSYVL